MTHCVIVLPELLTVPEEATVGLKLPALEKLLGKGKSSKTKDKCVEHSLMRHFTYDLPDVYSIPAGKIRWAADFNDEAPEFCVCADPVHMLADIDHARLMDASSLKLSMGEAQHYIEALNKVFSGDGIEFVASSPDRWYLTGSDAGMLKTLPVKSLVGRNVASFLPEGDASKHWRTLTTEIQMLLFADSMNQTREDQGQLLLNALWVWGGGVYKRPSNVAVDHCSTNDAFCRGLANLNDIPLSDVVGFESRIPTVKTNLLMDSDGLDAIIYGDYSSWSDWILRLEKELFEPLLKALKSGEVEQITLNVGNGREFLIKEPKFLPFWRKRKNIASYVSEQGIEHN